MKLTPYTFTITNVCETHASYQINLEVLNSTTFTDLTIMNISLNEKEGKGYSTYDASEKTLENASFSRKIENGYLYPLEEKTFTLRLWMDEDTPTDDAYMNQTFQSKVTIVTSYLKEAPTYAEVITNCSKNGYQTTECMLENSKYDTESLAYDETVDNNLRYIGSNPNNYVLFNNELWRIIGVMNNVEDSEGSIDSRIKLIRNESIGSYSWDASANHINEGAGVNEWSQADAMKLMNPGYESESVGGSLYWNRKSGKCYNNYNDSYGDCDFTFSGLEEDTKSFIEKVVWNTGSNGNAKAYNNLSIKDFYSLERSSNTGKICGSGIRCTDNVPRTTTWRGYIGLMYPSDYGFSVGKENADRETCIESIVSNGWSECSNDSWLFTSEKIFEYTMMPTAYPSQNNVVFGINSDGRINASNAYYSFEKYPYYLKPTLYLKSNIFIKNGEGTMENPYMLERKES